MPGHYSAILKYAALLLLIPPPDGAKKHDAPCKHKTGPKVHGRRHHIETLSWGVKLSADPNTFINKQLDDIADRISLETGLVNHGRIGELKGHYLFSHSLHNLTHSKQYLLTHSKAALQSIPGGWGHQELSHQIWKLIRSQVHDILDLHPDVEWHTQQFIRYRHKRALNFKDPAYVRQWHLHNELNRGQDINVLKVWERNVTGRGVVAAVVDDGLEWTNPDLRDNYYAEASWDLNDNDHDPMPNTDKDTNHHGTRCAGEIAASKNSVCGVGVAYNAKIAGIKILGGPMTDSLEAAAFTKHMDHIDVYSCSWGPDDDGKTVDGPHYLAQHAMHHAVDYGRRGYGSIFVVASGNGGYNGDNCNFDGYATSIYTVTIGAVDEQGAMPYYAEECASMLAVTFSSGGGINTRDIVTTDWTERKGTGCTDQHTGTSAAAPLAAGMIALMLEVRPCLTWRDVQHIIVMAAVKVDVDVAHWTKNMAGLHHSHKHGFGLMDAWRLVNAAKTWKQVPWLTTYTTPEMKPHSPIPPLQNKLPIKYNVTSELLSGYNLMSLEYVYVTVTLQHERRGEVEIKLRCPSGTMSILAATRAKDLSSEGFKEWTFSTVRCWGEPPEGVWTLIIQDKGRNVKKSRGLLVKWTLRLHGTPMTTAEVKERIRRVNNAVSGKYLYDNQSAPCWDPPLTNKPYKGLSEKTLKILTLTCAFCAVMAVYETLEYIFCYDDEKKKQRKEMKRLARERASNGGECDNRSEGQNVDDSDEETRLLDAEDIPLRALTHHNVSSPGVSTLGHAAMVSVHAHGQMSERGDQEEDTIFDQSALRNKHNAQVLAASTQHSNQSQVMEASNAGYLSDILQSDSIFLDSAANPHYSQSDEGLLGINHPANEVLNIVPIILSDATQNIPQEDLQSFSVKSH